MSARRKQVIAAQAAAVAVLVLIVYVTFLAPGGSGPLSGIEAPGGDERVDVQPPRQSGGKGEAVRGSDGRATRAGRPRARGGTGSGGIPGTGTGAGSRPGSPSLVNRPNEHQYKDTVATLLRKVGDRPPPGG